MTNPQTKTTSTITAWPIPTCLHSYLLTYLTACSTVLLESKYPLS